MILIDSNVPMYLVGAAHPSKTSARDALHVAIMRRHGIESILTFDRGFDQIPDLRRVSQ